ncbi:acyl-CoA thioesterase [uncultured Winogradskyella sp.]|uniref:acyl-CoA thioesterase n=1 Tax=uncultured Winogradskyella sp. TaxID=395353 RepID=UPI003511ED9B
MYKTVEESKIQISELMLPSYKNFGGKIHGGYILNLMDQIAFACASKHSGSYCVTASVDKVDFLNPIEVGELVTMKASINYIGNSSMVVGIRVESENIHSGQKKHCNSSYFTMVAVNDQGDTVKVPGLVLKSKIEAKRFIKAIKRRESDNKKTKTLNEVYKNVGAYLDDIKNHRVKINF